MQDVNNDMDNLFRKAAEQYPLQTDGADWQKVFAGLQDASMPVAEDKEKKRRFLWLFLLLPLGLLWAVYYKGDNQPGQRAAVAKENVQERGNDSQRAEFNVNKKSSKPVSNNSLIAGLLSGEVRGDKKKNAAGEEKASVLSVAKEKVHGGNVPAARLMNSSFLKNKKEDFSYRQLTSDKDISLVSSNTGNRIESYKNKFPGSQPDTLSNRIDTDKTNRQNHNQSIDEAMQVKADSTASVSARADSVANNNSNANKSRLVKAKPRVKTGFYAGLLGSFDASTIKLQRINKTGYGFELLIGYRFSKRISVESGVNRTDKKYYSIGKYFDKSRTSIPEASKIIYTNGTCAMFEIPAMVKYDFAQKKKSSWFVTAGLSSYIMKDETYSYYANHSGNYYNATKKYSHSGSNLFSVASLSAGYQLKLNKHLSLRAEPYIKMPLNGIGIAKMPITSTGIAAGFTRSF